MMTVTQKEARKAMRTTALILIVALSLWFAPIRVWAQNASPDDAVILVMNLDPSQNYRIVSYGTGFMIGEDGIAVTNAHVVWPTTHDYRYMVAAVVGKEMYRAEVICASGILDRESRILMRDIARIRLQPWAGPGQTWSWVRGDPDLTYTLHRGDLPKFPTLTIETYTPSGHLHALGYGKVSAYPRLHRSEGTVTRIGRANDGTPLIGLDMSQPMQPGDSGSPLLDEHEHVIGIMTWVAEGSGSQRWAQGAVATQSCGR